MTDFSPTEGWQIFRHCRMADFSTLQGGTYRARNGITVSRESLKFEMCHLVEREKFHHSAGKISHSIEWGTNFLTILMEKRSKKMELP